MVNQGLTEYGSGDYEAAHSFFAEAYRLVSEYKQTIPADDNAIVVYNQIQSFYFVTLILTQRQVEVSAMLDELDEAGIISLADSRFVSQAFKSSGNHDILKWLLKTKVDARPNDAKARVDLAIAYYDDDDKEGAIEILKEATVAMPKFAKEIEQLIKSIEAGRSVLDAGEVEESESAAIKESLPKIAGGTEVTTEN